MMPECVPTRIAAELLGLSTRAVLRAVRRGDLRIAFRSPGGHLRFHPADLDAYARSLKEPGRAPAAPAARERENQRARGDTIISEELAAVLGLLPCGILVVDASGRVIFMNERAQRGWPGGGSDAAAGCAGRGLRDPAPPAG